MTTDTLTKLSENQTNIHNFINENQDVIYKIVNDDSISQQNKSVKLLELIPGIHDACYTPYDTVGDGIVVYPNGETDPLLVLLTNK